MQALYCTSSREYVILAFKRISLEYAWMHALSYYIDYVLHLDVFLSGLVSTYGVQVYFILFLIIFCETGLIITPFLPGDSLLFAAGSLTAQSISTFTIMPLFLILITASIIGNQLNFWIGKRIGPRIFSAQKSRLFNQNHLIKTHLFYQRHGGKAIIFARFLPIIRTFVPFVAGIGQMETFSFLFYNIISAFLWIGSLLSLGYFLGSIPVIKEHFTLVIYGIIFFTLLPPFAAFLRATLPGKSKP